MPAILLETSLNLRLLMSCNTGIGISIIDNKPLRVVAQFQCRLKPNYGTLELWFHYSSDRLKHDAMHPSGVMNISFLISGLLPRYFNKYAVGQFAISIFDSPTKLDLNLKRMLTLIPKMPLQENCQIRDTILEIFCNNRHNNDSVLSTEANFVVDAIRKGRLSVL